MTREIVGVHGGGISSLFNPCYSKLNSEEISPPWIPSISLITKSTLKNYLLIVLSTSFFFSFLPVLPSIVPYFRIEKN
jgi:hypothetical protein